MVVMQVIRGSLLGELQDQLLLLYRVRTPEMIFDDDQAF